MSEIALLLVGVGVCGAGVGAGISWVIGAVRQGQLAAEALRNRERAELLNRIQEPSAAVGNSLARMREPEQIRRSRERTMQELEAQLALRGEGGG